MWFLYQVLYALALLVVAPWMVLRRGLTAFRVAGRRLGGFRSAPQLDSLWIHAVSVGEVGVAGTLLAALPASQPIVLTTVTPTGQERARANWGERARVTYLPFEFGFAIRRFVKRFDPVGLITVEGDLWPLVLRAAKRIHLPVVVVNGRIGDRSFRRMQRLRTLLGPILGPIDLFAVQSQRDAERLGRLGVDRARIVVTGNLKFDTAEPAPQPDLEAALRQSADGRPILVAGSTMAGEEDKVLDAFEAAGGGSAAMLVLAPRHPERWDEVAHRLERRGQPLARRSEGQTKHRPAVVLLDTLGELAGLYRIARAAYIGGTLVPTGGHNPLEAMRFGVPVAVGPSMENFRDMARQFDEEGAWRRVQGPEELAAAWSRWAGSESAARADGARGRELFELNRGALERTLKALEPILQKLPGPAGGDQDG
jgi:3-deoxy-D-manno-octulosonic-acid transferase